MSCFRPVAGAVAARLLLRRAAGVDAARPGFTRALILPTGRLPPALLLTAYIRLPPPIDGRSVLLLPLRCTPCPNLRTCPCLLLRFGIPVPGKHIHGSKKGEVPRLTIELIM